MSDQPTVDLSDSQQEVLSAVAALEDRGDTATIEAIGREAGQDTDSVEAAVSVLTDHNLLSERRVELDDDATGVGREYTIKG